LELHDHSFFLVEVFFERRHGRHEDHHFELLVMFVGIQDPVDETLHDLVLDALVRSGRDEELVLDVDELSAVFDEVEVSVHD
jgi:predicted RNA-binding protein associated with RNAse of E/G family